jgi:hypothetical protein
VEATKNVLESLMEHTAMHGVDVDADKARLVVRLFEKHAALVEIAKVGQRH